MVVDVLLSKPDNVVEFMIDWLRNNGSKVYSENKPNKSNTIKNAYGESSDEDEDDDDVEDLPSKEELAKM
jgi:DUF1009 family protein